MKKSIQFVLIFVAGLTVGGGAVESFHHSHDAQLTLSRKLRCQTAAREFVRQRSSDAASALIDRVDYSAARGSCIAAETDISNQGPPLWSYNVFDTLTEEVLFATPCEKGTGECSSKATESQNAAFEDALRNASK